MKFRLVIVLALTRWQAGRASRVNRHSRKPRRTPTASARSLSARTHPPVRRRPAYRRVARETADRDRGQRLRRDGARCPAHCAPWSPRTRSGAADGTLLVTVTGSSSMSSPSSGSRARNSTWRLDVKRVGERERPRVADRGSAAGLGWSRTSTGCRSIQKNSSTPAI